MTTTVGRVLVIISRVVFVAGLVVFAVGVDTEAVTIDRSALGFLLWLLFGGLVLSFVVNLLSQPAATVAALPRAGRAEAPH